MNNTILKSKKGFSLMELLIVLAIIAIMTAVLFVNRNDSKAASDVENASRKVAAQIRSLQNEALNGKIIGSEIVCSFKYHNGNNNEQYDISYFSGCNATISTQIGSDELFDLNSKGGVKFGNNAKFFFVAPLGKLNPNSTQEIIIESKMDSTVKAKICVYVTGSVEEKKSSESC